MQTKQGRSGVPTPGAAKSIKTQAAPFYAAPGAPTSGAMSGKLTVEVEAFKPLRSNTLYGFITFVIPAIRLRVIDATVHQSHGRRWIGLPAKPQIDRDGHVRRDDRGKFLYTPVVLFTDRATADAFSARAIAALLECVPDAFDEDAGGWEGKA